MCITKCNPAIHTADETQGIPGVFRRELYGRYNLLTQINPTKTNSVAQNYSGFCVNSLVEVNARGSSEASFANKHDTIRPQCAAA